MVKDAYNYLFHCSEYRSEDRRWACFGRNDQQLYWNGAGPDKYNRMLEGKVAYGSSPDDAWKKINIMNAESTVV